MESMLSDECLEDEDAQRRLRTQIKMRKDMLRRDRNKELAEGYYTANEREQHERPRKHDKLPLDESDLEAHVLWVDEYENEELDLDSLWQIFDMPGPYWRRLYPITQSKLPQALWTAKFVGQCG